tara:strand:+ start:659 stop:1078 length:420 start_codon:yes stop_codon:yes gene_type:complete
MTRIAGASQFLNQATVSNRLGLPAYQNSILQESGLSAQGILDVGRRLAVNSGGISGNARFLIRQQLEQNAGSFNNLFSLTGGASATVDSALTQIRALRSSVPSSREIAAPQLTGDAPEGQSNTSVLASETSGTIVDEEV